MQTQGPAGIVACRHGLLPEHGRLQVGDAQCQQVRDDGRKMRLGHLCQIAHKRKCALPHVRRYILGRQMITASSWHRHCHIAVQSIYCPPATSKSSPLRSASIPVRMSSTAAMYVDACAAMLAATVYRTYKSLRIGGQTHACALLSALMPIRVASPGSTVQASVAG